MAARCGFRTTTTARNTTRGGPAIPRGASFPEIGETVRLRPGGKGAFRAFVAQGVELQSRRLGTVVAKPGAWLERRDGSKLDMSEVYELAVAGDLPMATALRIETDRGDDTISVERVALIHAPTVRHAARNMFLAGLAVDAMILVIASQPQSEPTGCTSDAYPTGFLSYRMHATGSSGDRLIAGGRASAADAVVSEPSPAAPTSSGPARPESTAAGRPSAAHP
jgi:hypothetical protein